MDRKCIYVRKWRLQLHCALQSSTRILVQLGTLLLPLPLDHAYECQVPVNSSK